MEGKMKNANKPKISISSFLFLCGVPLVAIGYYQWKIRNLSYATASFASTPYALLYGMGFILLGILNLFYDDDEVNKDPKSWIEQTETKPEQLVQEIKAVTGADREESGINEEDTLVTCLRCLSALCVQTGQKQRRLKKKKKSSPDPETKQKLLMPAGDNDSGLELLCQEACYLVLRRFPKNDKAVSSAVYLLALVARNPQLRSRCIQHPEEYGLEFLIQMLRDALSRAKLDPGEDETEATEEVEQLSAEVQKRGCLLLGALADGDPKMAAKVVQKGAIETLLEAVDWYRYHEDVANWALWAVFVLCYDHSVNKRILIQKGGVQKVVRVMKDVPDVLEVQRHGIAVLFDLMREVPESNVDIGKIRLAAMNSGFHLVVSAAMDAFPDSEEINMMGTQMLLATGCANVSR